MGSKPQIGKDDLSRKIVFFDGQCNICNRSIDFILKRTATHNLYIASLQGHFSSEFLSPDLRQEGMDTFLYYDGTDFFKASEAVFQVSKELKGVLPSIVRLFRIFPRILTDKVYYFISKNRYLIAGKRTSCRKPTIEEQMRFFE